MGIAVSDEVLLSDDVSAYGGQLCSTITDDGGRVVTWINADGALVTQRYAPNGAAIGDITTISGAENGPYSRPIFATSDGGWVQSFITTENGFVDSFHTVRYTASGELLSDYVIEDASDASMARLVKLPGDNYTVFNFTRVSDYLFSVSATFFDADGQITGTKTLGLVDYPNAGVTSLDNGTWSIWLNEEGEYGTYRLYGSDGTLLNSVSGIENGKITFDEDGSYTVLRDVNDETAHTLTKIVEHFNADGQLLETVTHPPIAYSIAFMSSQTTKLENGNTVVIWTDHGWDSHGHLFMRVVDAQGNLVAADTELTKINPYDGFGRVVELSTGSWVVLWQDKLQVFNPDGTRNGATVTALGSSDIIANDDGGWTITYTNSTGEAGIWGPYAVYTRDFHPNDINNAPVALTWFHSGLEDTANSFSAGNFFSYEPDGGTIAQIVIEALPIGGELLLDGIQVVAGQVIDVADIEKLTWTPPLNANGEYLDSLKFNIIDDHGAKSTQPARLWMSIGATDDAPTGEDLTITIREDERIHLTRDMFPVFDIDGEILTGLDITPIVNNGTFTQHGLEVSGHTTINWEGIDSMYFQPDENASGDDYANFTVKYITAGNSMSEEHIFTINVLSVNDAPQSQNELLYINRGERFYLNDEPQITDVEGDDLKSIVITSLPEAGKLMLGDVLIDIGDEILADDIDQVNFIAGSKSASERRVAFGFQVRDSGGVANNGDDLSDQAYRVSFVVKKANVVAGTMSDDIITGSRKTDIIQGGAGSDIIFGHKGEDDLYGGTGADIFVLKPRGEVDNIYDFSLAEDRIDLTKTRFDNFEELQPYLGENDDTLAFIGFRSKTIRYEYDGLQLFGIHVGDLTEGNFIFG